MTALLQYDLRVVPCDTCGAPLEGVRAGGRVACRFCQSEQQLLPREEARLVVGPRVPEPERIAMLRQQDMLPRAVPAALRELLHGDRLAPWLVSAAVARWQSARRERRDDELFALTFALTAHYERMRALTEERALCEGALDALGGARERHLVRALLARSAALSGDPVAGDAWLACCDPTAADLEADGNFRYSKACIETVRGRFEAVLAVLGQSPAEVPLPNALDPLAGLLRANAWERLGRVDHAVALLASLAEHGGPLFHLRAHELREQYPTLRLCEKSWLIAEPRIQRHFRLQAKARAFGGMGVAMAIGLVILLACALAVAGSVAGDVIDLGFGLHPVTLLVVVFVAMLGFLLLTLGYSERAKLRREQRLRETGRLVSGVVVHRVATGNATMNVPEMMVRVLVLDKNTGYLAQTETYFRDPESPAFARGAQVALRIDHDDPHRFALVL